MYFIFYVYYLNFKEIIIINYIIKNITNIKNDLIINTGKLI